MARPARPERSRSARSSRQLSRFYHSINPHRVFGTHNRRMMSQGDPPDDAEDNGVGYRKPPRAMRFTKGQSGNPAGRPRGRHREAPYEAVLGQMVKIREGGAERYVMAAEAFLLQLTKRALEGDDAAARASLTVIEEARERQGVGQPRVSVIVMAMGGPGR